MVPNRLSPHKTMTDTKRLAIPQLKAWLETQPRELGQQWLSSLDERKQEEAAFHDLDRKGHRDEDRDSSPNRKFYDASRPVADYMNSWMTRRLPGSAFLDYACGNGAQCMRAVRESASLAVGIDISNVSINNATEKAVATGVSDRAIFLQRDCEDTQLPANAFDACLCSGMLHHLDLTRAFPELHRIMAPGGRILAVEALAYNPFINWYRARTPALRTEWETKHILSLESLDLAREWFRVENVRYFLMAAPLAAFLPQGWLRRGGLRLGNAIDSVMTRVPLLQLWSWQFCFELVKPA
jgi:ubiquinone/menaquinone biosynthesis C-methylase UbiE